MSKSHSHFGLIAIAIMTLTSTLFAQAPTDDLNGKTIHLYVESDDFTAFYFQNGDLPFTNRGLYQYTITLTGLPVTQQDFYISSNGTRPAGETLFWSLGTTGLAQSLNIRFTLSDFQGKDTLWIIVDPVGPITAPPILSFQAPKTIHLLNPWTATAPVLVWGENKTRKMTTTANRCGWFTAMILDPNLTSGHFAEIHGKETYGRTGLGSNLNFDFTALFSTHGNSIWLNTQTHTWSAAWPGMNGVCQYKLAATVRDFSKAHPDFDFGSITGDHLIKGMVQNRISPVRKPQLTTKTPTAPVTFSYFNDWWTTDTSTAIPANLRRSESCFEIPMNKSTDGQWEFFSYRDDVSHGFWPINGTLNYHQETSPSCYVKPPPDSTSWVTNGPAVNANFCLESHATFIYAPGQNFVLRGDDDIWIFINDSLVIDLGGVHTPKSDSVDLGKLNLVAGQEYRWDFFYCDRQPCGSSLRMKTDIVFKQNQSLFAKNLSSTTPGTMSLEIWKRLGDQGSCASVANMGNDSIKATNLTFQLLDDKYQVIETLTPGTFHGGITIATSQITLDTARLSSSVLVPGSSYRVAAFEAANPGVKVEMPFRMTGTSTRLLPRKTPSVQKRAHRAPNALGRKVPVSPAQNIEYIKDRTK